MDLSRKILCSVLALLSAALLSGCGTVALPMEAPETVAVTQYIAETSGPDAPDFSVVPEETLPPVSEASEEELPAKAPWYTTGRLIYHACGGIDGISYTNSREAMEATLADGNTLVEVDFLFTEDGQLICLHKWIDMLPVWKYKELKREYKGKEDQIPETQYTLDQFLKKKVKGKFTGLTASDIISYLEENPDLYIIVDTKEPDLSRVIGELLRLCGYQPELADRLVIQLYDRGQKEEILKLYPFRDDNFLFTCYKFDPLRVEEILALCAEERIGVVTVSHGSWEAETVNLFLERGIVLFEHTLNLPENVEISLNKGIYGFYTDFLQESELNGLIY